MGKPRQRYSLFDLKIDECSFVDSGDNTEAHITLFKRDQTTNDDPLPESVVAELIKAEADRDERDPGKVRMDTLTKKSDVAAEVNRLAEEKMKADPQLTPVTARYEVWMENSALREAQMQAAADRDAAIVAAAATGGEVAEKTVAKGADVAKEVDQAAAELRKNDPSLSVAEARMLAWTPDRRDRHNRAHGAG